MIPPLRSRRIAVLCVILILGVSGCTDGLLVPETSLCGTDGNDACEMNEVVVEEEMPPPPTAHPTDPVNEPLPGGWGDAGPESPLNGDGDDGGEPIQTPDPVPVSKAKIVELIREESSWTST